MHGFKPTTERDGINLTILIGLTSCIKPYRLKLQIV